MKKKIAFMFIFGGLMFIYCSEPTQASIRDEVNQAAEHNATEQSVELALVKAIIEKESEGYPYAIKNDYTNLSQQAWFVAAVEKFGLDKKNFKTWSSMGCMQVLYVVAYDLGFRGTHEQLFKPDIGIMYGCMLLKQLSRPGRSVQEIISRYNQGGAYFKDLDGDGVKDPNEPYNNQKYVDDVYRYYKSFGGTQ
jgi:soluble lytic murein transglycosylase-like protein